MAYTQVADAIVSAVFTAYMQALNQRVRKSVLGACDVRIGFGSYS